MTQHLHFALWTYPEGHIHAARCVGGKGGQGNIKEKVELVTRDATSRFCDLFRSSSGILR